MLGHFMYGLYPIPLTSHCFLVYVKRFRCMINIKKDVEVRLSMPVLIVVNINCKYYCSLYLVKSCKLYHGVQCAEL